MEDLVAGLDEAKVDDTKVSRQDQDQDDMV